MDLPKLGLVDLANLKQYFSEALMKNIGLGKAKVPFAEIEVFLEIFSFDRQFTTYFFYEDFSQDKRNRRFNHSLSHSLPNYPPIEKMSTLFDFFCQRASKVAESVKERCRQFVRAYFPWKELLFCIFLLMEFKTSCLFRAHDGA